MAPVMIREPGMPSSLGAKSPFTDADMGKYEITKRGLKAALLGLGNFYHRTWSALDEGILAKQKAAHSVVVTLEDGVVTGDFGRRGGLDRKNTRN